MTSLVYGNIDKKNATNLLKSYDKFFNSSSLTIPIVHDLQEINIKHPNPDEKSNCVTLYNFMGKLNITNEQDAIKIILGIIGTRILSQTFFDELRTKKQLGYLVNMNITSNRNKYYITQKVQSDKSIDQIIESIHDFNKNVKKYLIESEFDNYVKSIKKELLEPEYSLGDKINKYLPEITSHEYVFNRNKILSEQIDKITKDDVVSYFNELLLKPIKIIINGN
jgi:secreted Zn-dependent insulinase-like peptidase